MQNYLAYASLINAIIALLLGALVLIKDRKKTVNRLFSLVALITAVSLIACWQLLLSKDTNLAMLWVKIFITAASLLPLLYFQCTTSFLEIKHTKLLFSYYFLTLYYNVFLYLNIFIFNIAPKNLHFFWPTHSTFFDIFLATHYLVPFPYLIYLLVINYKKAFLTRKLQIKYIIPATLIAFLSWGSIFFTSYNSSFLPYGIYSISLSLIIFGYALTSLRLRDLRLIFSKIFLYTILIALIYLFIFIVSTFNFKFFGGFYVIGSYIFILVASLLFLIIIIPMLSFIQGAGDLIFFRGNNPKTIIKDILMKLSVVVSIDEQLNLLAEELKKVLKTDDIGFVVFSKDDEIDDEGIKFNPSIRLSFIFGLSQNLIMKMMKEKRMIIRAELRPEEKDIAQEMDFHKLKNIAPLVYKNNVIGLIFISNKASGEGFTQEDIEFIEIIGSQASVAIETAILYNEVEQLNEKVQVKNIRQAALFKEQSSKLKEFFEVAVSRLRMQVKMTKDTLRRQMNDRGLKKKEKEFLEDSYSKVQKLAGVVEGILHAFEMDSSDHRPKYDKIDIKTLLKRAVDFWKDEALKKNLKIKLEVPKKPLPEVMGNEILLEQAILNLICNAVYYTFDGDITVSAENLGSEIGIKVSDTGIGIPDKYMPDLFTKFTRAKNAIKVYEEGSGLGLFIVKKIIDAHPGTRIKIDKSALNKGTTIVISLPID